MCDIGWTGWVFVVVYFLSVAAIFAGILFGVGCVISILVKKLSEPSTSRRPGAVAIAR